MVEHQGVHLQMFHLPWYLVPRQDYRTLFQPVKFKQNSSGGGETSRQAVLLLTKMEHFNGEASLPAFLSCLYCFCHEHRNDIRRKDPTNEDKSRGWWSKILEWIWIFDEVFKKSQGFPDSSVGKESACSALYKTFEKSHGHYAARRETSPIWLSCYNPVPMKLNIPFK